MCDPLAAQAALVNWWHGGMDLGNGVITQGESMPERDLLPRINLPQDLTGKTVLDIGAWDGYIAFECERRGAKRVVAVDSFVWGDEFMKVRPNATGRAGFDLAHNAYRSKVEAVECEVLELSPVLLGTFDAVLFLGVLYHMRHPLLALEKAAAMLAPHGLLIIESYVFDDKGNQPAMHFYPGSELAGDPTNWWGPNAACVAAMLHSVGCRDVQMVSLCGERAAYHAR